MILFSCIHHSVATPIEENRKNVSLQLPMCNLFVKAAPQRVVWENRKRSEAQVAGDGGTIKQRTILKSPILNSGKKNHQSHITIDLGEEKLEQQELNLKQD